MIKQNLLDPSILDYKPTNTFIKDEDFFRPNTMISKDIIIDPETGLDILCKPDSF